MSATDPAVINKYRLGFNECASEVSKYLSNVDGLNAEFRARLLNHLANVTTNVEQPEENKDISPKASPVNRVAYHAPYPKVNSTNLNIVQSNAGQILKVNGSPVSVANSNMVTADVMQNLEKNNNISQKLDNFVVNNEPNVSSKVIHGVQTFPTQMQSGEVAFIIPAANMVQYGTIPNYVIPVLQPQGAIQISNSPNNVIQAQHTVPIAYSGCTTSSHSVVTSVVPNTTFINSTQNTVSLPVSLVTSENGGFTVQQREQSPQFTSFPVNSISTQATHIQKLVLPSNNINNNNNNNNNSNKEVRDEDSTLRSRRISPSVESRSTPRELEKLDPMWRPW